MFPFSLFLLLMSPSCPLSFHLPLNPLPSPLPSQFEAEGHSATYRRISRVDLRFPKGLSEDAKDLIFKLLQKDPRKRMALDVVPNHPWILRNARGMKK